MNENKPKRATIEDVARLANVGVGTVSRYVTGNGSVSPATRERIREAIEHFGYRPNVHAMGLRGVALKTVGIVIPDISNPLFSLILKKLEARLRASGYTIVLASSSADQAQEAEIISTLLQQNLRALFLIPVAETNPDLEDVLDRNKLPTIVIDRYFRLDAAGYAHIQTDHASGMRAAVRHLVDHGHRNLQLLYVGCSRPGIERAKAFSAEIRKHKKRGVVGTALAGSQYTKFAEQAVADLFQANPMPDAVIVGHNQMLPHVLTALRRLRMRVGDDLSVVTCDHTDLVEFHTPPIACISRDLARIGDIAFELFNNLAESPENSPEQVITTTFSPTKSIADRSEGVRQDRATT